MKINEMITKIESSDSYKEYKEEHKDAYIAHFFCMHNAAVDDWQAGYYSKKTDKITVFELKPLKRLPEEEVFKKEENLVKPLITSNVKIEPDEAFEIIEEVRAKHYKLEDVTKTILLLQTLEKEIYNVTLVTKSLNLIHIKIDAETGEIMLHEKKSIMSLRAD